MTFLTPWFLLALVPVAALAMAYLLVQRRRRRYAVRFATLPMLDKLVPKRPGGVGTCPRRSSWSRLGALGLAAARPEIDVRVPYERATVMVAIDTSGSMQADDVDPNRLEAAKSAAGPSSTRCRRLQRRCDRLRRRRGVGGSGHPRPPSGPARPSPAWTTAAVGPPSASRSSRRRRGRPPDEGPPARRRRPRPGGSGEPELPARLVLLSDGANTAGRSPDAAAQAARKPACRSRPSPTAPTGGAIPARGSRRRPRRRGLAPPARRRDRRTVLPGAQRRRTPRGLPGHRLLHRLAHRDHRDHPVARPSRPAPRRHRRRAVPALVLPLV